MLGSPLSAVLSEIQANKVRLAIAEMNRAEYEARIKRSMEDQYQAYMSELSDANQGPLRVPIVRRKRGGQ